MLQTGIIKKLHHSGERLPAATKGKMSYTTAEVEITRSSACGESCASCKLCPGQTAIVEAVNDINADTGDTVIIDMADTKVLGAAFLVYIVPLVMLIAGYFLGCAVFNGESAGIITGFLFMAVTFAVIIRIDRKIKRKYTPHIVRIISSAGQTQA